MIKDYAGGNNPKIKNYINQVFPPEDEVLREIRERSDREGLPAIQVGQNDGLHLEVLARAIGAKKTVEIGTLGGYSGVCLLRGMGSGGELYTFEFEPKHAEVARESFQRAGFENQTEIYVGPAAERLDQIKARGPFDLVFIDADKVNYPRYLQWAAENLKVGGVVLGDNTFAWGMIADERFDDPEDEAAAKALREFNFACSQGGRFRATLIPTGEGLTVAVKIK